MVKSCIFRRKIFRVSYNRHGWFVTRSNHEKLRPCCLYKISKSGLQVHVWWAIGYQNLGRLKLIYGNINAAQYQKQVLHDILTLGGLCVPKGQPWIFMQNLAPAHNAHTTCEFLAQWEVRVLDWPNNFLTWTRLNMSGLKLPYECLRFFHEILLTFLPVFWAPKTASPNFTFKCFWGACDVGFRH